MISDFSLQRKLPAYAGIIYPILNFSGGLNTKSSTLFLDKSNKFSLQPNQLTLCENMLRTASGNLVTRPGRSKLNSTPISPPAGDSEIRSLFELRRSDAVDRILCNVGNSVYYWNGTAWTSIGTVATNNKRMHWCQFQNVAMGVNGSDAPVTYDGTTYSNAPAGSPPSAGTAICSYRNRVWILKGQTLSYSALGNHLDWTTVNDAGQIPVPTTLGRGGTGLFPFWDRLIVWTNDQVFQVTGTGPSTFEIRAINFKYGHGGSPYGIVAAGNELYYCNSRGVHGLSVTMAQSEVGDVEANYTSGAIEPDWQNIPNGNMANIVAVNDVLRNLVIFLCSSSGNPNNQAFVGDYYLLDQDGNPTFSRYTNMGFSSACLVTSLNGYPEVLFGDYSGSVYRQTEDETDDGTTIPITGQIVTDVDVPGFSKTWRHIVAFTNAAEGNLIMTGSYDFGSRVTSRTIDMTNEQGDLLGSTFTIGVSALGAAGFKQSRISLPGHGRFLTLNFTASVAARVTIGGFILYADLRRVVQ